MAFDIAFTSAIFRRFVVHTYAAARGSLIMVTVSSASYLSFLSLILKFLPVARGWQDLERGALFGRSSHSSPDWLFFRRSVMIQHHRLIQNCINVDEGAHPLSVIGEHRTL